VVKLGEGKPLERLFFLAPVFRLARVLAFVVLSNASEKHAFDLSAGGIREGAIEVPSTATHSLSFAPAPAARQLSPRQLDAFICCLVIPI
jgi:hypothetical protein